MSLLTVDFQDFGGVLALLIPHVQRGQDGQPFAAAFAGLQQDERSLPPRLVVDLSLIHI